MTLLEILVKELSKCGGWPVDSDDERTLSASFPNAMWGLNSAGYYAFAGPGETVTREQYEAALSASNTPEWNGEGLPPVGCVVEVRADDFEGGWFAIKVVYIHNGEIVGIVQSDNEYLNDRLEKFSPGYNGAKFRPIRSEADRKRDEAVNALIDFDTERKTASIQELYPALYDAIAAGKIPGIRIE